MEKMDKVEKIERYRRSLLRLAAGDALGASVEFMFPDQIGFEWVETEGYWARYPACH